MARRQTRRPKAEDQQLEDGDASAEPRSRPSKAEPYVEPVRPAPPVDPRELDRFELTLPVTLEDVLALADAVRALWPGAAVEAYCHDGKVAHVAAWWGDYHRGAIVRRAFVAR